MEGKKLLILGAGGHGKSVAEAALLSGDWINIAFLDDSWPTTNSVLGFPVLAKLEALSSLSSQYSAGIVAIGNNKIRQVYVTLLEQVGLPLVSIIHPAASVSASAKIGVGTTIMASARVGVDASLGKGCIVNSHATVDHDVTLNDFVHIGIGVHLAGGVKVGLRAWLQAGICAGYHVIVSDDEVCTVGTILQKM